MNWHNIDLHIHTPASSDFQQSGVDYLDILRRAESRGLAIIAFTDHNTVAGYRQMMEEIQQLELLDRLKRILPEEQARLSEYHRLLAKILVLPGFEFTATFGFHILGIFPPEKPAREIEYLLLDLNIPPEQLDEGSATVGATSDVLTAYRRMDEAGGLVIAAHANSTNGIAMRGFPFGGQTKIAYTQDEHLHALEVTDLEYRGARTTATFFNGTKPEYPRRMHCIQGSDSHRLILDPQRKKNLGLGERTTDVLLPEVSFQALRDLFLSNDFARTRPHRQQAEPAYDFIRAAREEGPNIIQDFHERMTERGGNLYNILKDVCAFANTNGGTLYIGLSADLNASAIGVPNAEKSIFQLEKEINNRLSPPLQCTLDSHDVAGKKIVRILVPRGNEPPYAIDESKIYLRSEAETDMAVRDEIVELVLRGSQRAQQPAELISLTSTPLPTSEIPSLSTEIPTQEESPPRTGVEVVSVEERNQALYYTLRDLRNGNVVKNVTQKSARLLWKYAITRHAKLAPDLAEETIQWQGDIGLVRSYKQGKSKRYDLIQRTNGDYRYYFGVTDDGIHGPWKVLVGQEDD